MIEQQSIVHRKTHKQRQTRAQSREKSRPGLAQINTHTKLENASTQINTNVNTYTHLHKHLYKISMIGYSVTSAHVDDLPY